MIDGGLYGIYMPYEPTGGSRNINISENKITNASYAVELNAGKNNSFYKNHISSNTRGILLRFGGNTNLISNNISNNEGNGIRIEITDYNNYRHCIRSNSIYFNGGSGIYLGDSYRNTISDNTICFNGGHGISILQSEGGSSDDNNITNNIIKSNENHEIYINGASDNKINYNIINDNKIYGSLALWYGNGNIITGNTFFNGGLLLSDSIENTISNNTVNDKSLVYYEGVNFTDEIKDAGQVILVRCNKISIENQDLSNTSVGIQLFDTAKCNIRKNKISNNEFGIHILDNSRDNTISRNTISDNDEGMVIANSDSNIILENNFIKNRRNARLSYATENRWRNNYWDRPRFLPKPIFGIGVAFNFTLFPWVNFDWNPAKEPYDIPY